MRHYILVAMLFLQFAAFGQDLEVNESGSIQSQKVFEFPDKSASEIYKQSKLWVADYYRSAKDVIGGDIEDQFIKGSGFVESGAKMEGLIPVFWDIDYRFSIEIKDGKSRMTIYGFVTSNEYGRRDAEVYCVKNKGGFRTNAQSEGILDGIKNITKSMMDAYGAIFDYKASDDW